MRVIKKLEQGKAQKGLFSIIVPVLNNAGKLQRCIDSFAGQSANNKELIIVDGCSNDGTLDIIDRNKHLIAESYSGKDNSVYEAMNHGVCLSQGEWLLFLGSDDVLWNNDVLMDVARLIGKKWSRQRIVYGQVAYLNSKLEIVEVNGEPWSAFQQKPIEQWTFHHQGIFHHRSLFEEHGLFDESFRVIGDHELLLRELKAGEALFLEGVIVAYFSFGGITSRPENVKLMYQEREKILLLNMLDGTVVTRRMKCKIYIYESLRVLFGREFADKIWRLMNRIRGR